MFCLKFTGQSIESFFQVHFRHLVKFLIELSDKMGDICSLFFLVILDHNPCVDMFIQVDRHDAR